MTQSDYAKYLHAKKTQIAKSALGQEASLSSCNVTNMDGGTGQSNPACYTETSNVVKRVDVMDQSEYVTSKLMIRECLPPSHAPYPPPVSRNSTFSTIPDFTYEEYLATQEKNIADADSC
jgi:hypothetical protein